MQSKKCRVDEKEGNATRRYIPFRNARVAVVGGNASIDMLDERSLNSCLIDTDNLAFYSAG